MLDKKTFEIDVAGKTLTIEASQLAEQANAAVIAKYGETVVLATAVMSRKEASTDYMPLKVDYEEKFYAAGKIIGSRFIRREGRASEEAVLAGRLVDRTIRPLFDSRVRNEIQVVVTVLQIDEENDPEFVGLLGASTALLISDIPWNGPVAGVRVVQVGNEFKINPDNTYVAANPPVFDAFVSGSRDRINMLELGGLDAQEKDIAQGFTLAQKEINRLVEFQEKIRKEIGKEKVALQLSEPDEDLKKAVSEFLADKLGSAVFRPNKMEQHSALGELKTALFMHLKEKSAAAEGASAGEKKEINWKSADFLFEDAINNLVHEEALTNERRPDGRKLDELRKLDGEVALFSRTHGSALFMRGNTQALAVTTLAAPGAEQMIETMETTSKRRFMLHYNFPPFSVGEIGTFRGPGRREIGHGNLARKSLERLIPTKEEFPYTIRVVSEIMSSNGSSSMATVCASSLSLMDAGVPLKKPAAGIAMGLMMKDVNTYKVLTDIQGPEDHHGDMDFKVAGTADGVTGMQMDIKVDGLTVEILEKTMAQARKARLEILEVIKKVLPAHREKLSPFVPTIRQLKIAKEKIGAVIGPGGKVINGLIEKYGLAGIDIDEDGGVFISGTDLEKVEAAVAEVKGIAREFKVGEIVEGNIVKIIEVGAIVDLGGGKDGMVHISELKEGYVKKVEDVVKVGDFVRAKIIRVGDDGRIGLSIKQLK